MLIAYLNNRMSQMSVLEQPLDPKELHALCLKQ